MTTEPDAPRPRADSPTAALSKEEFRAIWENVSLIALRLTRSKTRADVLMSNVYEKLVTTRRWTGKHPLDHHLIGIVKSLLNIQYNSKKGDREAVAHDGYHREVRPGEVPSPEESAINAGNAERRRAHAVRELEELEKRAAKHPVMAGVLRCKANGTEKAADIARDLNVPVTQVYRAIELLKDHLERIRAARGQEEVG